MEMIACFQVYYSYITAAGTSDVLRGVDMRVQQGEHIAIIGPSGSGKSTLLRLCAAFDRPARGEVCIEGKITTSTLRGAELARFRREYVGLIFQHFSLLPALNALENVMLPLLPYAPRRTLQKRATSLLAEVGLMERLKHYPELLSGGEQQRVAIARALLAAPPILLADEPTGSLDAATALHVMEILRTLCREHQCTLIVVTHDMNIAHLADRQLRMIDGRLEA